MIYFPETINTISTTNTISPTHSLVSSQLCTLLTLCMLASWSHEVVVFFDLLSSSHPITSSLFPYLSSTDAPCSRLGDPVPPSPKWRPHSQGPRRLPYRDPEHYCNHNCENRIYGTIFPKLGRRDKTVPCSSFHLRLYIFILGEDSYTCTLFSPCTVIPPCTSFIPGTFSLFLFHIHSLNCSDSLSHNLCQQFGLMVCNIVILIEFNYYFRHFS
jgi:hypothetical protein